MFTRYGFSRTLALLTLLLFTSAVFAGGKNETAVTVWLVFFNNPDQCIGVGGCDEPDIFRPETNGAVCYLGGQSVQANGRITIAGRFAEGTTHGCIFSATESALIDSDAAEVHAVLQEHGWSKKSGYGLEMQLLYFMGGCNPDCVDTQFSIHKPADANGGVSVSDVLRFTDSSMVEGANSTLMREDGGVSLVLHTRLDEDE
jgi:hypothetical protein